MSKKLKDGELIMLMLHEKDRNDVSRVIFLGLFSSEDKAITALKIFLEKYRIKSDINTLSDTFASIITRSYELNVRYTITKMDEIADDHFYI